MKETIEHNNRFYGEELKTESEQLKEWLVVANKEIERLENIIKEAREYIKNLREDDEYLEELHFNYEDKYKLLEILDKENNNEIK